jgi:hypothetical protein
MTIDFFPSTDEIFKASSYLTESYAFDPTTKFSRDISHAPFNRAFGTDLNFFGWLERTEGESADADEGKSTGEKSSYSSAAREIQEYGNKFRLERFGKAMSATVGWETPGAIFQGKLIPPISGASLQHSSQDLTGDLYPVAASSSTWAAGSVGRLLYWLELSRIYGSWCRIARWSSSLARKYDLQC